MDSREIYENKLKEAKELYYTFDSVLCPTLSCEVYFNSSGFNHIQFQKGQRQRNKTDQILRFSFLKKAYTLVGLSTTFQEYELSSKQFKIKNHKAKSFKDKKVSYWGLVAILDNYKIRVVLRKIGNGNTHFWSVMPYWKTSKDRDEKLNNEKTTII